MLLFKTMLLEFNRNKTIRNIAGCSQPSSSFSGQNPCTKGSVLNTRKISLIPMYFNENVWKGYF